jgi:hypothetical protein
VAILASSAKLHWNYFLALERDMEVVARYVEFAVPNFQVYSIELAHLLFAAASEVDVVSKVLCKQIEPSARRNNINDYKAVLLRALPDLPGSHVLIPRYGLTLTPWDEWGGTDNPYWWHSYNNVKHERDLHFAEATLKHALNALAALLLVTFHHYTRALAADGTPALAYKDTNLLLQPESTLFRLPEDYYYATLVDG